MIEKVQFALNQTLQNDNNQIKQGEAFLSQQSDKENYIKILMYIIDDEKNILHVRVQASICFKNYVEEVVLRIQDEAMIKTTLIDAIARIAPIDLISRQYEEIIKILLLQYHYGENISEVVERLGGKSQTTTAQRDCVQKSCILILKRYFLNYKYNRIPEETLDDNFEFCKPLLFLQLYRLNQNDLKLSGGFLIIKILHYYVQKAKIEIKKSILIEIYNAMNFCDRELQIMSQFEHKGNPLLEKMLGQLWKVKLKLIENPQFNDEIQLELELNNIKGQLQLSSIASKIKKSSYFMTKIVENILVRINFGESWASEFALIMFQYLKLSQNEFDILNSENTQSVFILEEESYSYFDKRKTIIHILQIIIQKYGISVVNKIENNIMQKILEADDMFIEQILYLIQKLKHFDHCTIYDNTLIELNDSMIYLDYIVYDFPNLSAPCIMRLLSYMTDIRQKLDIKLIEKWFFSNHSQVVYSTAKFINELYPGDSSVHFKNSELQLFNIYEIYQEPFILEMIEIIKKSEYQVLKSSLLKTEQQLQMTLGFLQKLELI